MGHSKFVATSLGENNKQTELSREQVVSRRTFQVAHIISAERVKRSCVLKVDVVLIKTQNAHWMGGG